MAQPTILSSTPDVHPSSTPTSTISSTSTDHPPSPIYHPFQVRCEPHIDRSSQNQQQSIISQPKPMMSRLKVKCHGRRECQLHGCMCGVRMKDPNEMKKEVTLFEYGRMESKESNEVTSVTLTATATDSRQLVNFSSSTPVTSSTTPTRKLSWKRGHSLHDAVEYGSSGDSPASPSPFNFTKQERLAKKREWRDEMNQVKATATGNGQGNANGNGHMDDEVEQNLRLAESVGEGFRSQFDKDYFITKKTNPPDLAPSASKPSTQMLDDPAPTAHVKNNTVANGRDTTSMDVISASSTMTPAPQNRSAALTKMQSTTTALRSGGGNTTASIATQFQTAAQLTTIKSSASGRQPPPPSTSATASATISTSSSNAALHSVSAPTRLSTLAREGSIGAPTTTARTPERITLPISKRVASGSSSVARSHPIDLTANETADDRASSAAYSKLKNVDEADSKRRKLSNLDTKPSRPQQQMSSTPTAPANNNRLQVQLKHSNAPSLSALTTSTASSLPMAISVTNHPNPPDSSSSSLSSSAYPPLHVRSSVMDPRRPSPTISQPPSMNDHPKSTPLKPSDVPQLPPSRPSLHPDQTNPLSQKSKDNSIIRTTDSRLYCQWCDLTIQLDESSMDHLSAARNKESTKKEQQKRFHPTRFPPTPSLQQPPQQLQPIPPIAMLSQAHSIVSAVPIQPPPPPPQPTVPVPMTPAEKLEYDRYFANSEPCIRPDGVPTRRCTIVTCHKLMDPTHWLLHIKAHYKREHPAAWQSIDEAVKKVASETAHVTITPIATTSTTQPTIPPPPTATYQTPTTIYQPNSFVVATAVPSTPFANIANMTNQTFFPMNQPAGITQFIQVPASSSSFSNGPMMLNQVNQPMAPTIYAQQLQPQPPVLSVPQTMVPKSNESASSQTPPRPPPTSNKRKFGSDTPTTAPVTVNRDRWSHEMNQSRPTLPQQQPIVSRPPPTPRLINLTPPSQPRGRPAVPVPPLATLLSTSYQTTSSLITSTQLTLNATRMNQQRMTQPGRT